MARTPLLKTSNRKLKPYDRWTEKERAFFDAYFANRFDVVKAFRDAGYSQKVGRDGQRASAHQILRRPHIRAAIDERLQDLVMSSNEALARHSEVGRSDISEALVDRQLCCPKCDHEFYAEGEMRIDLKKLKELGLGFLIKEVTVSGNRQTVKLYTADDARRDIMKAQGAFRSKRDEAEGTLLEVLARAAAAKANQPAPSNGEVEAEYSIED